MSVIPDTAPPRFGIEDDVPVQVRSGAPAPLRIVLNPAAAASTLWRHRELIRQFAWREVVGRSKGTQLGFLWTFLNPLLILVVNTFVFAIILRQQWSVLGGGPAEFPLTMLCGMTMFGVFAETVCASPMMIVSRPNFVTKVVFPIEVFPAATLGCALFYAAINVVLIVAGTGLLLKTFSATIWMFPVVLVPLVTLTLGLSWFLAALGVFLRDINSVVGLVVYRVLVFMTPLFFPITAVPERYRGLLEYNPLTVIVENARRTLMWGREPDWVSLGWVTALGLVVMQLGYAWFERSKRGFADVV